VRGKKPPAQSAGGNTGCGLFTLLIGSRVNGQQSDQASTRDPGFNPEKVLSWVTPSFSKYKTNAEFVGSTNAFSKAVKQQPGVQDAALALELSLKS